jgi:long-chain acyl-CoA synthetase
MNLAHNLELSASFFPNRLAIRDGDLKMTYAQLNDQANRIATGLIKMRVKPGELIGLCALNSANLIAFYFGVLKAGAVAVTLSGMLTGDELTRLVSHAKPRLIFAAETKLQELEQLKGFGGLEKVICSGGDLDLQHLMEMGSGSFKALDMGRTDTAAILYTGGTTGIPKGVMLTHENIIFSSYSIAYYERSTENDIDLNFLPFNHVFGQIHITNATIMSAGCLELLPSFDMERVLELMEAGRITKFFAVPTVYIRFLGFDDLNKKLGKLRYCFAAGSNLAMEIVKQWKERTGITITESYGMTEVMPITFNHYYPERHVVGSVGQPVHGVEVQIRDTSGNELIQGQQGEICIRGRNTMKAYLNNPEGTQSAFWEGGWVRSGDIGLFDSDGYLYIVDRLKDLIITGGENVYPREIEEILYSMPEVEECAVIGLPDKEWGERVTAFIVPKPGHSIVPEELKFYLKSRLSTFKVPKEYIAVNEFPKSPTGKILNREIKQQFLERTNSPK